MIRLHLWKEIRIHLVTFRFATILPATFVVVVLSAWVLGEDFIQCRNAYLQASEISTVKDREEVYVPSEIRPTIYLKPSPLSIFCQGEMHRFGTSIRVERWEVPRKSSGHYGTNALMAAESPFDLYTIAVVILSLFGILLSYDSVSGERSTGVLKLQCSFSSARSSLFAAKFLAGVLCLAIPFVLSMASALLILVFVLGIGFAPAEWCAVSAVCGLSVAYGALFIALGLACSAFSRRSSTALILSLLFWSILVLLLPSAAQNTAAALKPLALTNRITLIENASEVEATRKLAELQQRYPASGYGYWTSSFSVMNNGRFYIYDSWKEGYRDSAGLISEFEPYMQARADRVWNAYREAETEKAGQAELEQLISGASPVTYLRKAFYALTGSGYQAHESFLESARRYRSSMIDVFRRKGYFSDNVLRFFTRRDPEDIDNRKYQARVAYYNQQLAAGKRYDEFIGPSIDGPLPQSEIPAYKDFSVMIDFASAVWPFAFMAFEAALIFLAGMIAFSRYDIR